MPTGAPLAYTAKIPSRCPHQAAARARLAVAEETVRLLRAQHEQRQRQLAAEQQQRSRQQREQRSMQRQRSEQQLRQQQESMRQRQQLDAKVRQSRHGAEGAAWMAGLFSVLATVQVIRGVTCFWNDSLIRLSMCAPLTGGTHPRTSVNRPLLPQNLSEPPFTPTEPQ